MNRRVYSLVEVAELARIVPRRPSIAVVGTAAVLAALVGAVIAWAALTEADLVVRGPARIRAGVAPRLAFASTSGEQVFAPSAGRVARVAVAEGQAVAAGDLLVALDTDTLANDLARHEAVLAAARARQIAAVRTQELAHAQYLAGRDVRDTELVQVAGDDKRARRRTGADVRAARAALAAARRDARRVRDLETDGAASRRDLEQALADVEAARARVDAARAGGAADRTELLRKQTAAAESDWAVREQELAERVVAAGADVAAAESVVANLRLELARAEIRADQSGTVTSVAVNESDPVAPGQGLVTIVPAGGLRVDAAVAAADIAGLRVGMRARVRLDAFDWQRYGTAGGTIAQIGTDAELLGPAGAQVPVYVVRIELDAESIGRNDDVGALKLGMTGTVEIVTGSDSLLALFVGRIRQAVSL